MLDERIKHYLNVDEIIDQSVDKISNAFKSLKKSGLIVKRYRLGDLKIEDTDNAGRIMSGVVSYNIRIKSIRGAKTEKDIEVKLAILAREVKDPTNFIYKKESYPFQNYYLNDVLES